MQPFLYIYKHYSYVWSQSFAVLQTIRIDFTLNRATQIKFYNQQSKYWNGYLIHDYTTALHLLSSPGVEPWSPEWMTKALTCKWTAVLFHASDRSTVEISATYWLHRDRYNVKMLDIFASFASTKRVYLVWCVTMVKVLNFFVEVLIDLPPFPVLLLTIPSSHE